MLCYKRNSNRSLQELQAYVDRVDQETNILTKIFPLVTHIDYVSGGSLEASFTADTSEKSGLTFDPVSPLYSFIWKTGKSWSGVCYQINVLTNDGEDHLATFKFE